MVAFLLAMWLATTVPVKAEYANWFKAGSGGFVGYYLNAWIPVPQGWLLILLWTLCACFFIFAFKIPALKITAVTGKGALWGLKKMPVRVPEKIKKPFTKLHVHNQVQKIKKEAPKAKVKAVKSAPVKEITEDKEGMQLPSSELLTAPKAVGGTQLPKDQMAQLSRSLESVLAEFGVQGQVVGAKPGPVVTLYEFEPASGVKTSRQ